MSDAYAYKQASEFDDQLTESHVATTIVERKLHVAAPAARKPIRRDAMFRRLLAVADLAAAAAGLGVLASVSGKRIEPVTLLTLPLIIMIAKLSGRYDHDEVVLHKSTLDEIPQLLALAACFSLIWSLAAYLVGVRLQLGGAGVAVLWGATGLFLIFCRAVARTLGQLSAPPERVLIVGSAAARKQLAHSLLSDPGARIELVGFLPLEDERRTPAIGVRARGAGASFASRISARSSANATSTVCC